MLASEERRRTALVWRVARHGFFQVLAGRRQRAKPAPRYPEGMVGDDRERGVGGTVRQAEQSFPKLTCRVQLRPCCVIPIQTIQD